MAMVLKYVRTMHSYFGLIALPWVIFFGVTGFYLNHPNIVLSLLPRSEYNETELRAKLLDTQLTPQQAADIARKYWPDSTMKSVQRLTYHEFNSIKFEREAGSIIVALDTGHYYTKTAIKRVTYSPEGQILNRKVYWKNLFGTFHRTGWVGWGLGTALADITSIALIIFGFSGLILWYLPKHKRIKRQIWG